MFNSKSKVISLKGRALRYLARREYSRLELERKLEPYQTAPNELADVLDALQEKGFISDERVLHSVLYRRTSQWGNVRIKQELKAKGISADLVKQTEEQLRSSEMARAHALFLKKFPIPTKDRQEQARRMRFLMARGFGGDVVRRVLTASNVEL